MKKASVKIFIIFLMILSNFIMFSCNDEAAENDNENINNVTETEIPGFSEAAAAGKSDQQIIPNLPEMDFEGKIYRVLGRLSEALPQFTNFEIASEAITGEPVNDAVYNRNIKLEDMYNVVIEQALNEDPGAVLKKSVTAGEDNYSLVFLTQEPMGTMAANGSFLNLNLLKYLDFEKPWWNKKINSEISLAGKLYYSTSDFNMMDKNRTYMLAYNKGMAKTFDLGNFYDLVYEGSWTVDKMTELCRAVADDLNGDGIMGPDDRWGYGLASPNDFNSLFGSCDNYYITKDAGDNPVLSINNERTTTSIDKLLKLTNDKQISFYCADWEGKVSYVLSSAASVTFQDGRSLFCSSLTHSLKTLAQSDIDYGVLPFPKYDENQKDYITIPDPYASALFAIPVSSEDTDFAAFMLEAVSAASKYEVLPYYYEISTKTKYTQDEESAKMIDLIFSKTRYDLGGIFNWGGIQTLFRETIPKSGVNNFVSQYEKIENKIVTDMAKTIDLFEKLS